MPKGTEREPFLRYDSVALQQALDKMRVLALEEDEANRKAMAEQRSSMFVSEDLKPQSQDNQAGC